jgi:hypothetical protein
MRKILPLLMALFAVVGTAATQTVTWGGEHVRMDVSKSGATLDFDCATGTITQTLPQQGTFSLKGTFTPEHGGPTRDSPPPTIDATYSGTIKDDTLTLRIVLAGKEKDPEAPQYALMKGSQGNVRKCR